MIIDEMMIFLFLFLLLLLFFERRRFVTKTLYIIEVSIAHI